MRHLSDLYIAQVISILYNSTHLAPQQLRGVAALGLVCVVTCPGSILNLYCRQVGHLYALLTGRRQRSNGDPLNGQIEEVKSLSHKYRPNLVLM